MLEQQCVFEYHLIEREYHLIEREYLLIERVSIDRAVEILSHVSEWWFTFRNGDSSIKRGFDTMKRSTKLSTIATSFTDMKVKMKVEMKVETRVEMKVDYKQKMESCVG